MSRAGRYRLAGPMTPFGLGLAAVLIIADQLSKYWLIGVMAAHPQGIPVTSFFNLVMVWNLGVSFGMFAADDGVTRWGLVLLSLVIVAVLLVWLARLASRLPALGVGLIIGGALGNVIDRLFRGAVADFFDFHLAGWHWPAFNVADMAIVVGVALLLVDGLFEGRSSSK